jgi:hypothetical protein
MCVFVKKHSGLRAHIRKATISKLLAFSILLFSGGVATSMELERSAGAMIDYKLPENYSYKLSGSEGGPDECLSFLRGASSMGAFVPSVDHQGSWSPEKRAAASSLGLIFGVKFALGPKEIIRPNRSGDKNRAKFDVWYQEDANMKALAVSDYRRCKKEKALGQAESWRWQR